MTRLKVQNNVISKHTIIVQIHTSENSEISKCLYTCDLVVETLNTITLSIAKIYLSEANSVTEFNPLTKTTGGKQ